MVKATEALSNGISYLVADSSLDYRSQRETLTSLAAGTGASHDFILYMATRSLDDSIKVLSVTTGDMLNAAIQPEVTF